MGFLRPETRKKNSKPVHIQHRDRIRRAAGLVTSLTAAAIVFSGAQDRTAMHTSILTGQKWMDELLEGVF
jgi:hypothetical protein